MSIGVFCNWSPYNIGPCLPGKVNRPNLSLLVLGLAYAFIYSMHRSSHVKCSLVEPIHTMRTHYDWRRQGTSSGCGWLAYSSFLDKTKSNINTYPLMKDTLTNLIFQSFIIPVERSDLWISSFWWHNLSVTIHVRTKGCTIFVRKDFVYCTFMYDSKDHYRPLLRGGLITLG